MSTSQSSTPSFTEFDPTLIPYQGRVLNDLDGFDYKQGVHELLLSGSVGSAKSILMAHAGIRHLTENKRARLGMCRRAMPDLRETLIATFLAHMEGDFVEGKDYEINQTKGKIEFSNGSEAVPFYWADKKYKRARSRALSAALFEELTENNDQDKSAYDEIKMRVGRLPHVKENFIMSATNPDSPDHWAHKYFIESESPTRHVYYSVTTDNPFLPKWYIEQLLLDLDPIMAQRMIYGKWVRINEEVVYYAYSDVNHRKENYEINPEIPIHLNFDFNIGAGKPMSACLHQFDGSNFHFFQEHVVEGARTDAIMDEIAGSGSLDWPSEYRVHMDSTGKHRDTRSLKSDYDIIEKFLANYVNKYSGKLRFKMEVPSKNPPIRTRHNLMNGAMKNAKGEHHYFVYAGCPVLHEGCMKTKLLKGASYTEDDSKYYQHVTTAAGYGICWEKLFKRGEQGTTLL